MGPTPRGRKPLAPEERARRRKEAERRAWRKQDATREPRRKKARRKKYRHRHTADHSTEPALIAAGFGIVSRQTLRSPQFTTIGPDGYRHREFWQTPEQLEALIRALVDETAAAKTSEARNSPSSTTDSKPTKKKGSHDE